MLFAPVSRGILIFKCKPQPTLNHFLLAKVLTIKILASCPLNPETTMVKHPSNLGFRFNWWMPQLCCSLQHLPNLLSGERWAVSDFRWSLVRGGGGFSPNLLSGRLWGCGLSVGGGSGGIYCWMIGSAALCSTHTICFWADFHRTNDSVNLYNDAVPFKKRSRDPAICLSGS